MLYSPSGTRDSDGWCLVGPALNIAFAIAEVVWIMTGRDDLAFLEALESSA